jgi:thymidylate synthase (FAD)
MTQNVRLIAMTQPVANIIMGEMSTESLIAYAARVSNPKNQENFDTAGKLLRYCMKHQHWSVFELAHIVMEINTTRDIGRQILRHRSFSFQEFSTRYADATKELGFTTREARLQDNKNRQNSIETDDQTLQQAWTMKQQQIIHESTLAYRWAIDNGIAKEQARAVLPEGCVQSRIYMAGSLRSWIHYCQLRMTEGTQKEHREIAKECWAILCTQFSFLKEVDNANSQ